MKRILVLMLIGIMLISSVSYAAPKKMITKDILKLVEVTEVVDDPNTGQNMVYIKFPNLGELQVMTVLRDRIESLDGSTAHYIDDKVTGHGEKEGLNTYDGKYESSTEDGKEWIVLEFWYTRDNMEKYVVNVEMVNEKNGFTYSFEYDSSVVVEPKFEREMKDISSKITISEEVYITDYQNTVTLTFPKMGSELKTCIIVRDRPGNNDTIVNYLDGSILKWYDGEITTIIDAEQKEFYQIEFVYTIGNIERFEITIEMFAGKSGVSFGYDGLYKPLDNGVE